ncbi:hypothetical protein J3F83DRAFT_744249 [Trichoderma novae-zelandiae]
MISEMNCRALPIHPPSQPIFSSDTFVKSEFTQLAVGQPRLVMNCNELQENATGERYVIKRPRALQWFHHGRLVKQSDEERQAGRFELFLDLLYVAIVANFSDDLAEHPDGKHLAKYMLIFAPAWHIWVDLREIMNSYYTDDLLQRLVILWVMALLVLYANNARLVDEDLSAMQTTAGAYVVARFTTMSAFLVCSFASHQHRTQARIIASFTALRVVSHRWPHCGYKYQVGRV